MEKIQEKDLNLLEEEDLNLLETLRLSKEKDKEGLNLLEDLRSSEEEDNEGKEEESEIPDYFPSLEEVEEIIGYKFKDVALLQEAYTHPSCKLGFSYERLEYVGDAVLNLLIAKDHYFEYPDLPPGKLTKLRAANVDTEKLARVALHHNLHKYLRHKKPTLEEQIERFMDGILEYPLHSNGLVRTPKILADIVESTMGAVFLDSDSSLDTSWEVAKRLLVPKITPATLGEHPATKLYEFCQKHGLGVEVVDKSWSKTGVIKVFVDNELVAEVVHSQKISIAKTMAENMAYHKLLTRFNNAQEQKNNNNDNND